MTRRTVGCLLVSQLAGPVSRRSLIDSRRCHRLDAAAGGRCQSGEMGYENEGGQSSVPDSGSSCSGVRS
ncbi:hypothetical protein LC1Hm_1357 [Halomicrobium sp. LC1Hm]|nr:hypothetical protein LC1Hm_1357 [Halomicrobium sp. LC1Hm]